MGCKNLTLFPFREDRKAIRMLQADIIVFPQKNTYFNYNCERSPCADPLGSVGKK